MPDKPTAPTIADCKALALLHRRRAVLVLALGGDSYAGASYGMTRADCKGAADLLDDICDLIDRQVIEMPGGFDMDREPPADDSRDRHQVALWDAINEYTLACGGDPGDATVNDRRMNAVATVERIIAALRGVDP